jgi:hypothetical protein
VDLSELPFGAERLSTSEKRVINHYSHYLGLDRMRFEMLSSSQKQEHGYQWNDIPGQLHGHGLTHALEKRWGCSILWKCFQKIDEDSMQQSFGEVLGFVDTGLAVEARLHRDELARSDTEFPVEAQ